MNWEEYNAVLNAVQIVLMVAVLTRGVRLLNARKEEIVALHDERHELHELLEVRRQRIAMLERGIEEDRRRRMEAR